MIHMKKVLTLVAPALAALALVSCQQDETMSVNTGKGIRFNAFMNNITRSTETTADNLAEFRVHALSNASGFPYTDVYTGNKTTGYQSTNVHYWPTTETENVDFYAYYPSTLTTAFGDDAAANIDANGTTHNLENLAPKTDIAEQVDLVIAYKQGNKQQNEETGVALNFKHALSQIVVNAKSSNANMAVVVAGVKVASAKGKGLLTIPTNTEQGTTLTNSTLWPTANLNTPTSYMTGGTDGDTLKLTDSNQSIMFLQGQEAGFMLIPQQLTAWAPAGDANNNNNGAYLSVLCRIYQSNGNGGWNRLYSAKDSDYNWGFAAVPISTNWAPGMKYTYNLEFFSKDGGGAGVTDPDPTDPTNPDGGDIDDGNNPGEDIVGGPIKFTVTVDAWKDAANAGTDITMDGTAQQP